MKKTKAAIVINGIWQFIDFGLGIAISVVFGLPFVAFLFGGLKTSDSISFGIDVGLINLFGVLIKE